MAIMLSPFRLTIQYYTVYSSTRHRQSGSTQFASIEHGVCVHCTVCNTCRVSHAICILFSILIQRPMANNRNILYSSQRNFTFFFLRFMKWINWKMKIAHKMVDLSSSSFSSSLPTEKKPFLCSSYA